eukprot:3311563-Pleurochrysis_carterae.AAC.1
MVYGDGVDHSSVEQRHRRLSRRRHHQRRVREQQVRPVSSEHPRHVLDRRNSARSALEIGELQ